jgi:hypothetical protein
VVLRAALDVTSKKKTLFPVWNRSSVTEKTSSITNALGLQSGVTQLDFWPRYWVSQLRVSVDFLGRSRQMQEWYIDQDKVISFQMLCNPLFTNQPSVRLNAG